MSDWDKLWVGWGTAYYETPSYLVVKAVGDKMQDKLEAVRGVVDTWDQYEDIGWHCKQLQSDIREVLGDLKEMQKEEN